MMLSALSTGMLLGLWAGLAPGPMLSLVITQTLQHSTKEGIKVALSPLITDLPIIGLCLLVLARWTNSALLLGAISLAGGLYLLFLAYESARFKPLTVKTAASQPASMRKGILVNFLNPHPYLFWITVGSPLLVKASKDSLLAPLIFLVCFYGLLVGAKILLALLVGRTRGLLGSRGYLGLMRLMGLVLAVFAGLLFKEALDLWGLLGR
jgi:threonine/homoserine/homoserine lactone efflux protein